MAKQKKLIIKHQTFREVTNAEVWETLGIKEADADVDFIDIKYAVVPMQEIENLDSIQAKSYQRQKYESEIKPLLEKFPETELYYFGATTVPLAVHLGYCIGSWQRVIVYNINRETNRFEWLDSENIEPLPTMNSFPIQKIGAATEVLYTVEISYPMQTEDLQEAIGGHFQTVSLSLVNKDKSAIKSPAQQDKLGYEFSEGLDAIATNIPNADKIHLIVAGPVGLCFLLGTKFNPNITKPVSLYQYNTNNSRKYEEIFIMQETAVPEQPITEEDQAFIKQIRERFKKELSEKISVWAKGKKDEVDKYGKQNGSWVELILQQGNYEPLKHGYWKHLPDISKTILINTSLSDETAEADKRDGFYLDDSGVWEISDRFIFNLQNRIGKEEEKVIRALRMFTFHEAFHVNQNLTNHTAEGIGRFPRMLEEADYVADVWTFLHEYAFSIQYYNQETRESKEFFKILFSLAIETMWSFAQLATDETEMQIRAVNRFLIWYWAFNLIDDFKCKTVEDIVNRLAIKPILEIKGLEIKARGPRTVFKLANYHLADLEIGYNSPDQKIYRHSNAAGLNIGKLVDAFRERNSKAVEEQVKTFYHILVSNLNCF